MGGLSDNQIDKLLDKKEELEDTAKELDFKIKELNKRIATQSEIIKDKFKTTDPVKLRLKKKKLESKLFKLDEKLDDNPLYQEMMGN